MTAEAEKDREIKEEEKNVGGPTENTDDGEEPEKPEVPTAKKVGGSGRVRTASMIPFPTVELKTPPECCGTFMSLTWDEETKLSPPDAIMKEVRFFCESQAMKDFCERAGLRGCSFEWKPAHAGGSRFFRRQGNISTRYWNSYGKKVKKLMHLHGNHGNNNNNNVNKNQYIRFWDTYKNDQTQKRMGVVFHGSPEERIPQILKNGLDPRYRRTQAFGKGEYFSKDPGLATTYCQGGHKLIVYLVFIPEEHEKYYNQRDRDIIVVNNVSHELPVGVLSFESVDRKTVQHTQQLRIEQKALKVAAIEKEQLLRKSQDEGAADEVIAKLDKEVHEAWDEYFVTKFDENRNLMEHLHLAPVALHD